MEKYIGFITQDIRSGVTIIFICLILICCVCMLDLWTGIDAPGQTKRRYVADRCERLVLKSSIISGYSFSSS